MDDTPIDQLVTELESADPADAADLADALAERLGAELEQDGDDPSARPA